MTNTPMLIPLKIKAGADITKNKLYVNPNEIVSVQADVRSTTYFDESEATHICIREDITVVTLRTYPSVTRSYEYKSGTALAQSTREVTVYENIDVFLSRCKLDVRTER